MSSIVIDDIGEPTALDPTAMADIAGGMDVKIDSVSSSVRSADDKSLLGPDTLTALINIVIQGLRG